VQIQRIYDLVYPHFRGKRLDRFAGAFPLTSETKILDVGGCPTYWMYRKLPGRFTALNLLSYVPPAELNGFELVVGDATRLPYADRAFDIAHSNSVIEHVSTWENQVAFANEVRRVGRGVWVQTPARYFPMEPHTLDLLWHWFPAKVQRPFLRHFTPWGWMSRPTAQQVDDFLRTTRLLTHREMKTLFPDCEILCEKVGGITKSYVAYRAI
jgi:hypothetical protein